jgi:hypothetical protein
MPAVTVMKPPPGAFEQLRFGGDAILTTVDTIIRS